MKVLVTGVAGFIGMHVALRLLEWGNAVVGIDKLNDYYDVMLKHTLLAQINSHPEFSFHKIDISNLDTIAELFDTSVPACCASCCP